MKKLDKWADQKILKTRDVRKALVNEFEHVLGDAKDERPLQTFLAEHPELLCSLAEPGGDLWCLDRPRLGSELIPDFLLASDSSIGFRWTLIELEGPNEAILTKDGMPAKKLAGAMKQIRDWRSWLRDNISYARDQLGLTDIHGECRSVVVIGRRYTLDAKQAAAYRALSTNSDAVMTYDRLLEISRTGR
jgi:Shedu protein SduA, C-terminal